MIPALFAEFAPLSPAAQWAIVSILGVILTLLLIWSIIRRKPPLDSELVKLNIAIESLQASVDSLTQTQKEHASHTAEIEALQEKVRTLERHREEDQRSNRTYTRESGERIYKRIDELSDSVNANFQSMERAIGQLEGKIEQARRI